MTSEHSTRGFPLDGRGHGQCCLKSGDVLFAGPVKPKTEIGKCVAIVGDVDAYAGGDIVISDREEAHAMFLGYYLNIATMQSPDYGDASGQADAVVHIGSGCLGVQLIHASAC